MDREAQLLAVMEAMEVPDIPFWMERHPEVIRVLIQETVKLAKQGIPTGSGVDAIGDALKEHEPEFYQSMLEKK